MDLGTVLGYVLIVVATIVGAAGAGVAPGDMIRVTEIVYTVVGATATVMIANPLSLTMKIPNITKKVFLTQHFDFKSKILLIVNYSEKARREGLLSLEDDLGSMDDVFLKKALELVVDGTDPEVVRNVMQIEIDNLEARHHHNRNWWELMATLAPGFALTGTLIGLVAIFANLSGGDMAVLGHGLAAAFLNTFYGAFVANVIALPIGNKLKALSEEEVLMRQILLEGTLSIQAGDNPRIVKDKLLGFLKPGERKEIEDEVKT